MKTEILETKRLILRKFTTGDMTALFTLLKDPVVNEFLPWFPMKSLIETEEFYEENLKRKKYSYAICLKEENIPIGYINVEESASYDFGYGLKKEYWHQGITTEAATKVIEKLKTAKIPFITATHDKKNPRSGEVMKKLGMEYCYSYEEQWQPKNIPVIFRMYQLNLENKKAPVYKKYWNLYENHFIEENI